MGSDAQIGERGADGGKFVRALGLWDVVAMNIVAVVGLRWIARSARADAPSVTLWVLACLVFFLPLAATLAELSSRYPEQGGIYAWTRRAFGPAHGFVCGWCMWVNNLFYFPSLLLFAAANALIPFGEAGTSLIDNRVYSVAFVIGVLWLCTALNIVGLTAGKWLQNVGSIATWIPALLLIGFGAAAFVMLGSATSFAPANLVPREDFWSTLSLWSAMCFAFSGFEISAMMGEEVRRPTRTIPLAILVSGVAITLIYILGSASVLVAVPASDLVERSGIADAVDLVSGRLGLGGLGALVGGLLAIGAIGGTSSWIAGAARVPYAVGADRALPSAFARLHPRFRTPYISLVAQAGVATGIFVLSLFLSVGGGATSVQEAYDILVNLTILVYFVPYLYLFAAFLRLRAGTAGADGTMRIPGGATGAWLVAGCGFLATAIAIALVFIPPTGTENVVNYEVNLAGQSLGIIGLGVLLYIWAGRRR
ncbi:MAG: APC family permease [Vicinamibacterales bacterium]